MTRLIDRVSVERHIMHAVVVDLIAAGFALSVDNGDPDGTWCIERSTNARDVMNELGATDSEYLIAHANAGRLPEPPAAFVLFVYGNDGWDVVNDYSLSLEPHMTRANALAEGYSEMEIAP